MSMRRQRALVLAFTAATLSLAERALAEGAACINDRREDGTEEGAFFSGSTQPGGTGTVTFVEHQGSSGHLEEDKGDLTDLDDALRVAAATWKAACPNARYTPNFATNGAVTRPAAPNFNDAEQVRLWTSTVGVDYRINSLPETLSGSSHSAARFNTTTGVLTLAGLCPPGQNSFGCERFAGTNYIDWGSAGGQQLIQHEIGHLLGLYHDSSSGSCDSFNGIMSEPISAGDSIKPEHCALADHRNCDEAVLQEGQTCPARPATVRPPCGNGLEKAGPCGQDEIGNLPGLCQSLPQLCGGGPGGEPWWSETLNPPERDCTTTSQDYCNDSGCGSTVTITCRYTFAPNGVAPPPETVGPSVFVAQVAGANAVVPQVTVSGWAAAASGVSGLAFWLDGQPVTPVSLTYGTSAPQGCTAVADPRCPNVGFVAVVPTANLAVGAHLLQVVAADSRPFFPGPSLAEIPFSLSATCGDTTPPTVSLTSPSPGSVVSGMVPLTATASDNVGVTHVQFLVDGSAIATDTSSPYSRTWNATSAAPGAHALAARAFDACGNSRTSAAVSVTVPAPILPPDIAVYQDFDNVEVPIGGSSTINATTPNVATSRRFRIANLGGEPLVLSNTSSLISAPCLSLSELPTTPVPAGGVTYFRVRLLCGTPGTYSGTVSILSNDPNEANYSFTVVGTVTGSNPPPPAPDIAVYQAFDGIEVPRGGSSLINSTVINVASSRRFRIANLGNASLTISNPGSLVSGTCLSLSETPVTPVPVGGEAFFRVRLYCGTPGTYSGTVTVLSNDPDEASYSFTVSGTVTAQ